MNDEGFTDEGSSSYDDNNDSQMADLGHRQRGGSRHRGSFGFGTTDGEEADLDIDVYEDEEDELDGVDTDAGNEDGGRVWRGFGRLQPQQQPQQPLRPEDIPWAGIEDGMAAAVAAAAAAAGPRDLDAEGDSNMSDGENVDPTSQSSLSQSQSQRGAVILADAQQQQLQSHQHQQQGMLEEEDDLDDASSSQAPSEYSSRPGAWQIVPMAPDVAADEERKVPLPAASGRAGDSSDMGFQIHEDGTAGCELDDEEDLLDTQWG